MSTLSSEAKDRIKAALVARFEADAASLRDSVEDDRVATVLDRDGALSVDDISQSDAQGELSGLLAEAHERRDHALAALEELDFSPTESVRPGSIVSFGGYHYVVGVVAESFEADGVSYEGLSDEAPLYAAIAGLKAGDSFTFNGREHTLQEVS